MQEFLTADEVALKIKTSKWFVYKHWEKLGGIKIGEKRIIFPKEKIETLIKEKN
jgi:hypothetical protein